MHGYLAGDELLTDIGREVAQPTRLVYAPPSFQEVRQGPIRVEHHLGRIPGMAVFLIGHIGQAMLLPDPRDQLIGCGNPGKAIAQHGFSIGAPFHQFTGEGSQLSQCCWRKVGVQSGFPESVLVVVQQDRGTIERHAKQKVAVGHRPYRCRLQSADIERRVPRDQLGSTDQQVRVTHVHHPGSI